MPQQIEQRFRSLFEKARSERNINTMRELLNADSMSLPQLSELRREIEVAIATEEATQRPFLGSTARRL